MKATTFLTDGVSRRWWLLVVALATSLALVVGGAPAGASGHVSGEGDGTGLWHFDSTGVSADPPCGKFTAMTYNGTFEGTFTHTASGATYQGPVQADIRTKNIGDWYENPFGIWKDPGCTDPHPGVPVELIEFRSVSSLAGWLECVPGASGTFTRSVSQPPNGPADIGHLTISSATCEVASAPGGTPFATPTGVTIEITSLFVGCARTDPNGGLFPLVPPTDCVTAPDDYKVS